MQKDKESIKVSLTPEQIRRQTSKAGDALELDIIELEERIAPSYRRGG